MVRCKHDPSWKIRPEKAGQGKQTPAEDLVVAHCAIVDYDGEIHYNSFICPRPPNDIIDFMGKDENKVKNGEPFDEAQSEIRDIIKGKRVVAHDIWKDLNSLQLDHESTLIRDTSTCQFLRDEASTEKPKLKDLAKTFLKRDIQKKTPHDPVEDATAAMDLYKYAEDKWEKKRQ